MKTFVHKPHLLMPTIVSCFFCLTILMMLQVPLQASATNQHSYADSILINKTLSSKKYKIKLYPSATQEVVFFTASGETGKVFQMFLFDLDGRLVKQTQIRDKETSLLTNFVKGCYTFEVFSDDERIENGTLTVR